MFSKLFNKVIDSSTRNKKALVQKFIKSQTVYFNYKNPTFHESAETVYKPDEKTLFLPVINRYTKDADLTNFTVRMGIKGGKYILIIGELKHATSQEDINFVFNELLKDWRWNKENAQYSLYDKRNGKPRKHRYKLKIKSIVIHSKNETKKCLSSEIL